MSRSYKKIPLTKDSGKGKRFQKRKANKAVRKTGDLQDGGSFKKCSCSYDICDWKWGEYTWEEVWDDINTSDIRMKEFYENILKKPYIKNETNKKKFQQEFYRRVGK